MTSAKTTNGQRMTIAFTAFMNFLGLTIAFPVFVPLCMDHNGILFETASHTVRALVLGIMLGIYPLAQFFTAPIMGSLSDRFGRKPVLLFSNAGNLLGNILMAVGIMIGNLPLILFSRLVTGGLSGSFSVIQSSISDISTATNRTQNFGLLGAMMGASLALGPAMGGVLSDHTLSPLFTFATPFWAAGVLTVLNYLQITFLFHETHHDSNRRHIAVNALTGLKNVIQAFTLINHRKIFIVIFLLGFGFNFFSQFFQYYLIERFRITNTQFGMLFAYIGVWSILTQALVVRVVSKRFTPVQVLRVSLLVLSLLFPVLLLVPSYPLLFAVILFIPMMNGLSFPNLTTMVSALADSRNQGQILGVNQSVQATAMFLAPMLGGVLVGVDSTMPIWVSFIAIAGAWVAFLPVYKQQKTVPAHRGTVTGNQSSRFSLQQEKTERTEP